MQRIAIIVFAFLLLVSTTTSVALAQDTTGAATPAPPAAVTAPSAQVAMVATARDGTTVSVKPLDDPGNPYREQYGQWDHWVYQFYQPGFNPAQYGGG